MIWSLIFLKIKINFFFLYIYKELIFLTLILFLTSLLIIITNQRNLIISLIGAEIALLAGNITFLCINWFYQDCISLVFILCILVISAIETAIGAGLLILCYAVNKTISYNDLIYLSD